MNFSWVSQTVNDTAPENAVHAGNDSDGSRILVGRSYFQGEQLPCKIIPEKNAAYVSYDGSEHFVGHYEVLCGHSFRWVSSVNGGIPENAFQAGYCKSGEPLFVGRAHFQGSLTPGKVHCSHGCLYIPYDGLEHSIQSYEVLVTSVTSNEENCCCCCCIQ